MGEGRRGSKSAIKILLLQISKLEGTGGALCKITTFDKIREIS